ncbi:hypothetical protein GOP47_0031064, partial [Adiantum capillus-veneris]
MEAYLDAMQIQEHILMSKIEYVKGEHSVAKNVAERIVLWSDFDKNGSDRILTDGGLSEFRFSCVPDFGVVDLWKRKVLQVCMDPQEVQEESTDGFSG